MGLAYEIVINSDPVHQLPDGRRTRPRCRRWSSPHAAYGHNSFFKGNYLFQLWTEPSSIIDYLSTPGTTSPSARSATAPRRSTDPDRQLPCAAATTASTATAGRASSIRRGARPQARRLSRGAGQRHLAHSCGILQRRAPRREISDAEPASPPSPQENLLYFIEKNAPLLEPWQREIVRIVRKIAQYFYPQRQTQVMNEGWATFWHHRLTSCRATGTRASFSST
jgi:stage V sporulation protein R